MVTKAEKIIELAGIVGSKAKRIKELKLECGQQATKICVLNERILELEQTIRLSGIQRAEALEACIGEDIIKATEILEQALKGE